MQNMVIEFISLLLTMAALKGMTNALAPFSYLVYNRNNQKVIGGFINTRPELAFTYIAIICGKDPM